MRNFFKKNWDPLLIAGIAVVASYLIFTICHTCINLLWMNAAVIGPAIGISSFHTVIALVILFTLFVWKILWTMCKISKGFAKYLLGR